MAGAHPEVGVVIPTRNRPGKLAECLEALAKARDPLEFRVYVGDSSTTPDVRERVEAVCRLYPWVTLAYHDGDNVPKARNFVISLASEELLVNVDDDVRVEADCVNRLVEGYQRGHGIRTVAGTVRWGDRWSQPQVRTYSGHTRPARGNEPPDFLIGALSIFPRALAIALPWNETIRGSDDIFIGSLWRAHGVKLGWTDSARAHHHVEQNVYPTAYQGDLIYALLFDALMVDRSPFRALQYEVIGFAEGARQAGLRKLPALLQAWVRGNRQFLADRQRLRALAWRPVDLAECT